MPHQALPGFSQPFCGRPSFRGYSPSYSSPQSGTGVGAPVDGAAWSYAPTSDDPLPTPYAMPSRRPTVNPPPTPTQHQLTATASLNTSKYLHVYPFSHSIDSRAYPPPRLERVPWPFDRRRATPPTPCSSSISSSRLTDPRTLEKR